MQVFKRAGARSPYYYAEIWVEGRRFLRSTGKRDRRAAAAEVPRLKAEIRAAIAAERAAESAADLDRVFLWFWENIGRHDRAAKTTFNRMGQILDLLGPATPVADLDDQRLQSAFLARRAMPKQRQRAGAAAPVLVAPATVNREIELLRRILNRARKPLALALPEIDWRALRHREPPPKNGELSPAEEAAILRALAPDARLLVLHYLLSGVRLSMAIGLRKIDLDLEGGRATFIAKGGHEHTIPISPGLRAIYAAALEGNETPHVFTWAAARSRGDRARGARYPWTLSGVRSAWERAKRRAAAAGAPSVMRLRVHDLRHTAATRLLRATGNLAQVQRLLGHSDIRTTARYAHVLDEDLRASMAQAEAGRRPLTIEGGRA